MDKTRKHEKEIAEFLQILVKTFGQMKIFSFEHENVRRFSHQLFDKLKTYLETRWKLEIGIVFESNPEPKYLLQPRVKLIADAEGNKIDGETIDLVDTLPDSQEYRRSIVKSLDPRKYNIPISDYFVAEAE